MIKFDLCTPILITKQIKEAAKATGVDYQELLKVALYGKGIQEDGQIVKLTDEYTDETGRTYFRSHEGENCKTGSEGIVAFCKEKGYDITPLTTIDIPYEVFYESSNAQWLSISGFAADVERRNDRLKRFLELNLPAIIRYNETRMLWEYVERLESNKYGKVERWGDGKIRRALNDVGYSLVTGWDEGMLEEFRKRDQERDARMDMIEKETAKQMAEEEGCGTDGGEA